MADFRGISLMILGVSVLAGCANMQGGNPQYSQAARPAPQELAPGMVQQVQSSLQQQGLYKGAIDGVWGPGTQNALQSYQHAHGLNASGQIDTPTLSALDLSANAPLSGSSTAPQNTAPDAANRFQPRPETPLPAGN